MEFTTFIAWIGLISLYGGLVTVFCGGVYFSYTSFKNKDYGWATLYTTLTFWYVASVCYKIVEAYTNTNS